MKPYFDDRLRPKVVYHTDQAAGPVDISGDVKKYRDAVKRMRAVRLANLENITLGETIFSDDGSLKLSYSLRANSVILRAFCHALSVDYGMLKRQASSSFLYFLRDSMPFVPSSINVASAEAESMIGLRDAAQWNNLSEMYEKALALTSQKRDFFSFIPMTMSPFADGGGLNDIACDSRFVELVDYVSDGIVMFHLRKNLSKMCLVGVRPPFKASNVKLPNVVASGDQRNVAKFSDSIIKGIEQGEYASQLKFTYKGWISAQPSVVSYSPELFKALCTRDIYTVAKIVGTDGTYAAYAESLADVIAKASNTSRLEFYYGDIFHDQVDELVQLSDEKIRHFVLIDRVDAESPSEYLERVATLDTANLRDFRVSHERWFVDHMALTFEMMCEYLRSRVDPSDVRFSDVMRNIAVYSPNVVLRVFGLGDAVSTLALSNVDTFTYPNISRKSWMLRHILMYFPWQDPTLQQLLSECDDSDGAIIAVLQENQDLVAYEIRDLSPELQSELLGFLGGGLNELSAVTK
jgi:hypothetical protein